MEQQEVKVEVSRDFPVPVSVLFSAWVSDDELKEWWKPGGNKLANAQTQLQEGGGLKYEFVNSDDEPVLTITGTYKEVEEEKKLVYTWEWQVPESKEVKDNAFLLKVSFTALNDESSIRIVQENFDDHETIHPHEQGWNQALDNLHDYLVKK